MTSRSATLRELANLLEAHPEIEMPNIDPYGSDLEMIRFQLTSLGDAAAATAALIVKAFPGPFRKTYDESYFTFTGQFAGVPVEVRTMRADVCVARQVGTKTVLRPDPVALEAVPDIEVEVPVFEYDCKPVLAEAVA